jgi:ferredoxin-type protein NapH
LQILRNEEGGTNFAVFCQHCLEPLCLPACPQQAVSKDENGIVRIDSALCVHCGMCIMACPESAPLRGVDAKVRKCDLCDGSPRCVQACEQGALAYSAGKSISWIKYLRWPVQLISFLLLLFVLVGTICSLSIDAFSLSCPLGWLQNLAASRTLLLTAAASAAVLMVLSLLAGRLFCGWICPFGFVLDLLDKILPQKLKLPQLLRSRLAKYSVAAASIGASGALGYQAFCTLCPIGTLCRSYGYQAVVGGAELAVIPALALLDVSEKRSWCRYLCPVGALLGLFARFGLLKISIGASRCKKFSCQRCAKVCPMGIIDSEQLREGISPRLEMSECISCLRCVDICPHGAAVIRFPWQKATPAEHGCQACETRAVTPQGGGQCDA